MRYECPSKTKWNKNFSINLCVCVIPWAHTDTRIHIHTRALWMNAEDATHLTDIFWCAIIRFCCFWFVSLFNKSVIVHTRNTVRPAMMYRVRTIIFGITTIHTHTFALAALRILIRAFKAHASRKYSFFSRW